MKDFYERLIEKAGFDSALVLGALNFSKSLDMPQLSRLFFDTTPYKIENGGVLFFEDAFYPYDFFGKLKTLALSPEVSSLYIYVSLLERSLCDFTSRIENTEVFFETSKRIWEAAKEYHAQNGYYGLYDYHFLANYVRTNILRLGAFEYQLGLFDGKKAIMLHVPDKASMEKENRLFSYRLARQYFGQYPIVGDSWLLFKEHKKMLPENSSIVSFFDDFDIVSAYETYDYSELFHVFGRLKDFSYENLPKETSLQRAYAERVKNSLPIGSGVGILKY